MSSIDDYGSVTKWLTGADIINNRNCFAFNFGYNGDIPIPSYSLPRDTNIDLGQYEFEKHYNCFLVFLGKVND